MFISCTLQNVEEAVASLTPRQMIRLQEAVQLATLNKVVVEKFPKVVVEIERNEIDCTWLLRFMPVLNGAVREFLRKHTDQRPEWFKTAEAAQPKTPALDSERNEAALIDSYYAAYLTRDRYENIAAVGDGGTEGIYDCSEEQVALYRALDSAREELEACAV